MQEHLNTLSIGYAFRPGPLGLAEDLSSNQAILLRLNDQLELPDVPHGLNESLLESFLDRLDGCRGSERPEYWLLTARITELCLLCAGHYADNCEYAAAGDLLANPRKITICPPSGPPRVKIRHGRLSDQLAAEEHIGSRDEMRTCLRRTRLQIEKPPVLQLLFDRMSASGRLTASYLNHVHQRMTAIADTIGFFCAWSIDGMEDLYVRLRDAPTDLRMLIESHCCRFDRRFFKDLGRDIRQMHRDPDYCSKFLVPRVD